MLLLALPLVVAAQLQIPVPVGYVNDFARVIDAGTAQSMQAVIDEVRTKSPGEIVVVTLSDLGGREPIDVARDIGRQWKIGRAGAPSTEGRNAGVVLLFKPGGRPGDGQARVAIASGSGAEGFITDALSGRIADAIGREAVGAGRYDAGLLVGVRLLAQAYAQEFHFDLTGAPVALPVPQQPGGGRNRFPWSVLFIILLFIFIGRRRGGGGLLSALMWGSILGGGRGRGGWGGGGFGGGGGGFGGGFGGFGGGGGFSGGGSSRGF